MAAVLLVCDQPPLIESIQQIGKTLGEVVLRVSRTVEEAALALAGEEFQVAVIHVMEESEEKEINRFLESVARTSRPCPTVILAEVYQDAQAISFFRAGVADYLSVSQDLPKLTFLLDVLTLRSRPVPQQVPAALAGPGDPERDPFYYIVTPETSEVMEHARRVAPQSTTLLLTGEAGTGKTRLARLIHDLSPRRHLPFLVVDCGSLSANLIESEMFGHVKAALTGAEADREGKFSAAGAGTLLLDEINALPLPLQAKLLRALDDRVFEPMGVGGDQPRPLQARIIAASTVPVDQEVLAGKFRADLFYRLNVVGFFLPPLREQRSAIVPLCRRFLAEFAGSNGQRITSIAPAVLEALTAYPWPGNIRELRNVIERAVALAKGPGLALHDIPERIALCDRNELSLGAAPRPIRQRAAATPLLSGTLHQVREEVEIQKIRAALCKHRNNRLRAALELGISRMGLYKKLHKYGLLDINQ
jgi:DNA-binding NtrC family response regulator